MYILHKIFTIIVVYCRKCIYINEYLKYKVFIFIYAKKQISYSQTYYHFNNLLIALRQANMIINQGLAILNISSISKKRSVNLLKLQI